MSFYDLNRFHVIVLCTYLLGKFMGTQMLFAIFSNYSPRWRCGSGPISRDCEVYTSCEGNLTFLDDHFQSAALEFGWICSDKAYLASAFSQLQFAGAFIGTFLFGTLSDLYGRKPISLVSLIGAFLSIFGSALAPSWQILHSFRFLIGVFIGGAIVAFATYVTELILPSQRMVLRGVFNWGVTRMILTLTCMMFPEWRSASIACAVIILPAILCIIVIFPESPTWLHSKGRLDDMYEAELYIAKFGGTEYQPAERKSIEHIKTFCEMIRMPGLLKRLTVLWTMWFIAAFCSYGNDLNSNTIYGNLFMNQIFFAVMITISKWVLLTVDTWYPAFSRRILHQGAQFVVCVCFLILSILTMKDYKGIGILVVNLLGTVFIEYTWDACFLCSIESLETSCRGSGTGSCSLVARIGAMSAPFLTYMNNFWPPSVYFSVSLLGTVNLVVSYNYLIETKGVDLDEVNIVNAKDIKQKCVAEKHCVNNSKSPLLQRITHDVVEKEIAT